MASSNAAAWGSRCRGGDEGEGEDIWVWNQRRIGEAVPEGGWEGDEGC